MSTPVKKSGRPKTTVTLVTIDNNNCWVWQGKLSKGNRYPTAFINGKNHRISRLLLKIKLGRELLLGMQACHIWGLWT